MELRQGPVGVHLRYAARPHHHAHDPRRGRRAGAGAVVHRSGRGRGRSGRRPRSRRSPHRRASDGRGFVRLRQVRPRRPGHQRRRLPRPPPFRGGGRLPRRARGRTGSGRRRVRGRRRCGLDRLRGHRRYGLDRLRGRAGRRHLHRSRDRAGRAAGGLRPRGGVAHRLPPPAPRRPRPGPAGLLDRAVLHTGRTQDPRRVAADRARRRTRGSRRTRRGRRLGCQRLRRRRLHLTRQRNRRRRDRPHPWRAVRTAQGAGRGDHGRRATGRDPRRPHSGGRARRCHGRAPGVGAAPGR